MAAFDTTRTTYGFDGLVGRIGNMFTLIAGSVASWNDARVTRNSLAKLSDRELEDIGLIRGNIEDVALGKTKF